MSDVEQNPSPDRHLYAGFMRQFDEARRTVAALDTVFRDGNVEAVQDAQRIIRQLADRVQELEGGKRWHVTKEMAHAAAKEWDEWAKENQGSYECFEAVIRAALASPPSSVQPEKERRPITAQQVLAAAACHERGRVVISTVQRTLRIGYREADELCRSIIAAGLVDGLEISPALLPVSPSPSMVGREGE